MPPLISIVAHTDFTTAGHYALTIPTAYIDAIEQAGGIPHLLPYTGNLDLVPRLARDVDGFIFPGGFDIDPTFFKENPIPELGRVDRNLDVHQLAVFDLALEMGVPILGICRGAQVINVALGGDLFQDIKAQADQPVLTHTQEKLHFGTDHEIKIVRGSRLYDLFGPEIQVNSRHHQAVRTPGKGLSITARSLDGVIEALAHDTLPIDLVQWHPELMLKTDPAMAPLFQGFVRRCQRKKS
jgi:putative glutamine amidotransferase